MGGGTGTRSSIEFNKDKPLISEEDFNKALKELCNNQSFNNKKGLADYFLNKLKSAKDYAEKSVIIFFANSLKIKDFIDLSNFGLEEIPQWVYNLPNLESLSFKNNQLSYIPEKVLKMISLTQLIVNQNQLTSLPETMGNLEALVLMHNQVTNVPKSLCEEIKNSNKIIKMDDNPLIKFNDRTDELYLLNDEYFASYETINCASIHRIINGEFSKESYLQYLSDLEYLTIKAYASNQEREQEMIEMGFDPMAVTVKLINQYLLEPSDELEEFLSTLSTTKRLQNSALYKIDDFINKITNRYKSLSEKVNENNPKNKQGHTIIL